MMITITRCQTLQEAEFLQMILESRGIASFIPDSNIVSFGVPKKGVRLQVDDSIGGEAKTIVEEVRNSMENDESSDDQS